MAEMKSVKELQDEIKTYKEQLAQVDEILALDPSNAEYIEAQTGLKVRIEDPYFICVM